MTFRSEELWLSDEADSHKDGHVSHNTPRPVYNILTSYKQTGADPGDFPIDGQIFKSQFLPFFEGVIWQNLKF